MQINYTQYSILTIKQSLRSMNIRIVINALLQIALRERTRRVSFISCSVRV